MSTEQSKQGKPNVTSQNGESQAIHPPTITLARAYTNFTIYAEFANGDKRLFDMNVAFNDPQFAHLFRALRATPKCLSTNSNTTYLEWLGTMRQT